MILLSALGLVALLAWSDIRDLFKKTDVPPLRYDATDDVWVDEKGEPWG